MPSFRICSLLLFFAAIALHGETPKDQPAPIAVDFESEFAPLPPPSQGAKVSGSVPLPLMDDSGWAGLELFYRPETKTVFSGMRSLRLTTQNITKGWAQLVLPGVRLDGKHFVKISVAFLAPNAMKATVVLRKREYPWTAYWEQTVDVRPEWRPFEFLVPPLVEDPDAILAITTKSEGDLLIDDLRVTFLSEKEMNLSAPVREGNLLPNSSFPLGLTNQWSLQHGRHGMSRAVVDPAVAGPTGAPALEFGVGGEKPPFVDTGSRLISPAFRLNGGRDHSVGLYIKGTRPRQAVQITLYDPFSAKSGLVRVVEVSREWQWVSFGGKLPYSMRGYYNLSIATGERIWIDGVTVREGSADPTFARSSAVELSLQASQSYALYTGNEPFILNLYALGDLPEGANIEFQLSGPEGDVISPDAVPIGPEPRASVTFPLESTEKFGSYLLTARVVTGEGAPLSAPAELAFHRVHPPRMLGRDAPDSAFGVHINPTPWEAEMVKKLGFNWVRLHDGGQEATGWFHVEPEPGRFDFTYSDRVVEILREQNLKILGMLNMTPRFYTDMPADYPQTDHTRQYFVVKPEHRGKWQNYCRTLASRYAGKIDDWEVMNEPYAGQAFFIKNAVLTESGSYRMTPGSPENYVQLLGDAFTATREANPEARVIWMMNHESGWNDRCIEAGALDFCNLLSYHYYLVGNPLEGFPRTNFARVASRLNAELEAGGKSYPFWNTEGSAANLQVPWTSSPAYEKGACEYMANGLVRSYLAFLSEGTEKWFVYTNHIIGVWMPFYYAFTAPDGTLSPAATALSAFMYLAEGQSFERTVAVAKGVTGFVFSGDERSLVAIASNLTEPMVLESLPKGWKLLDQNGNQVKVGDAAFSAANVVYLQKSGPFTDKDLSKFEALTVRPSV